MAGVVGGAATGQEVAGLAVAVVAALAWVAVQVWTRPPTGSGRGRRVPTALSRPIDGWPRTLARGVVWGVGLQALSTFVVEPLTTRITGSPVDLGAFDYVTGDPAALALMLALTWGLVVWVEEGLFRAVPDGLAPASGPTARTRWIAVVVGAAGFALAHAYQGATGVVATGVAGLVLGALFVREEGRLWAPMVAHGTANTLALVALYFGVGV